MILLSALCHGVFIALLMTDGYMDWKEKRLPNGINGAIGLLAILHLFLCQEIVLWQALSGALIVAGPMALVNLTKPGSFGGGDIKLCAAVGLFIGWKCTFYGACLGLVLGGLFAGILMLGGKYKRGDTFPLGPFLVAGFLLVWA